jgi:hypothetical protein
MATQRRGSTGEGTRVIVAKAMANPNRERLKMSFQFISMLSNWFKNKITYY